jgi:hypothetical protein
MKHSFLTALAAVFIFSSCATKDEGTTEKGERAILKINVQGTLPATKAYVNDENVATINNVTVFIFNIDGALAEIKGELSPPSSPSTDNPAYLYADLSQVSQPYFEVDVTTTAAKVVVIGNLGSNNEASGDIDSRFNNVNSEDDLYAMLLNVDNANARVLLSGTSAIDWTVGGAEIDVDGNLITDVSVVLKPISAKLNVAVNLDSYKNFWNSTPQSGVSSTSATTFSSVSVLYSAAYTHYFADGSSKPFSPTTNEIATFFQTNKPAYYSGLSSWTDAYGNVGFVSKVSTQPGTITLTSGSFYYLNTPYSNNDVFQETFYVFPSRESPYTIVTLAGEFDSDGAGGEDPIPVYFPVHFSGIDIDKNSTFIPKLENGKLYTVTLTLTGDAGGRGPFTPEIPDINAYLTVHVSAQTWETTTPINKEFQ